MTRVKICGITRAEDALLAEKLGATAVGFVFAKSPRRITARAAATISSQLSPLTHRVGVFVNQNPDAIRRAAATAKLSVVQLHGDEGRAEIRALKGLITIKAFQVHEGSDFKAIARCSADGILLDAYSKEARGGLGETFNWDLIAKALRPRIILAGGLNAATIGSAIARIKPFGVDASSCLETQPGIKSPTKMRAFFKAVAQTV